MLSPEKLIVKNIIVAIAAGLVLARIVLERE